jgi:hypothetical protein
MKQIKPKLEILFLSCLNFAYILDHDAIYYASNETSSQELRLLYCFSTCEYEVRIKIGQPLQTYYHDVFGSTLLRVLETQTTCRTGCL